MSCQGLRSLLHCCACGLLTLASVAGARASEVPPPDASGLEYTLGPGVGRCPSKAQFLAQLSREVGGDPFAGSTGLTIQVELTARSGGVAGGVSISENGALRGRRELSSGDCTALVAALALVVGVELDAIALPRRPPPTAAVATTDATPLEIQATVPVQQEHHGPALLVSVGSGAVVGMAPTVVPEVTVGLATRWRVFELVLEGTGGFPIISSLGVNGETGSASNLLVTGLACGHRWFLAACVLATTGVTSATGVTSTSGQGFKTTQTSTGAYFAPGLRLAADLPLNRDLALVGYLDVAAQVTRPSLQTEAGVPLWSAPWVTGALGFALQARIL